MTSCYTVGMKLKSKLAALMADKGINQQEVARATGLSPATVGKIYRDHFDQINNRTVTKLCEYFKLKKIDDLIELVPEEE